jgi:hypothetical protein
MTEFRIFRWRTGRGWFVLSGGADSIGDIRGTALARASADGATACVAIDDRKGTADRLLDDLEDLGAPAGYIVDIATEDDRSIEARLSEAGIIVIASDGSLDTIRSTLYGAALRGIELAHARGAVVLVEGISAALFGEWYIGSDERLHPGLGWLANAIILTASAPPVPIEQGMQGRYQLHISPGSAIAFGPDGEIELWGRRQVKVLIQQT